MTLHEFSTDVIPVIQGVISFIGIIGLYFVWFQIKQTNAWNKINTQHALLSDLPSEDQERRFAEICKNNANNNGIISKEAAKIIFDNISEKGCIVSVLNKLEHICAAINAKSLDENYAYAVHSARIINFYNRLQLFIVYIREAQKSEDIYIKLQKVAARWSVRYEKESENRKRELQKLIESQGAKQCVP